MVTRGAPTVQLLRPAGGRVAQVGLELRRQNLARRQQNIQADLAEMRSEIDRDRLRESARQFDVNQLFRREALEVESALSGRRLQVQAGQLQLGQRRLELTAEQAIRQENRAQQAQSFTEREFEERLRATRVRERRQGEQIRRGRESLDAKDFRADIEFLGQNLLRFDPETRQVSLPEGLQPLVQRIIERARGRGVNLTIPQLIEAASPVASQAGRQRVQSEARQQLSQRLGQAQVRNLNAAAVQKLEGGGPARRQAQAQARNLGQAINRDRERLTKRRSDIEGLEFSMIEDQRSLDDAQRNLGLAQRDLQEAVRNQDEAKVQTAQTAIAAEQGKVNEFQQKVGLGNRRVEQIRSEIDQVNNRLRLNATRLQGIGTGATRQIGGRERAFEPTTVPAAAGAERSQVVTGIIAGNQTRQAVEFWKKGLEDLETNSRKLDSVTEPDEREFRKRAEDIRRSEFESNLETATLAQQGQERDVTQFIANMDFPTAFNETVALNKQMADLKERSTSTRNLIESGKLTGQVLSNRKRQLETMSRMLDSSTQRKVQVQGKMNELSETKGNLDRLTQISLRQVGDASKPENTVAVRQIGARASSDLADIYGQAPLRPQRGADTRFPDERDLTPAEEKRRGQQFLASIRNGSYYRKVINVLDKTTRKFISNRRIAGEFDLTEGDRDQIMSFSMNLLNRNPRGFRLINESEAPAGVLMPPRLRGTLAAFVLANREQEFKKAEGEEGRAVSVPRNLGVIEFLSDPSAGIKPKAQVEREIRERLRLNVANGSFKPEVIPAFKTMMILRGFEDLDIEETLRPFDFFNLMGPPREVIRAPAPAGITPPVAAPEPTAAPGEPQPPAPAAEPTPEPEPQGA